jgi:hypothetical protein
MPFWGDLRHRRMVKNCGSNYSLRLLCQRTLRGDTRKDVLWDREASYNFAVERLNGKRRNYRRHSAAQGNAPLALINRLETIGMEAARFSQLLHQSPGAPRPYNGNGEQHGVNAVEHAAMAGQDRSRILNACAAFDEGLDEVPQLGSDIHNRR